MPSVLRISAPSPRAVPTKASRVKLPYVVVSCTTAHRRSRSSRTTQRAPTAVSCSAVGATRVTSA